MMSRAFSSIVGLMALVVALFPEVYIAQIIARKQCSLSCGDIVNISYPFHLKGHPRSCGDGHHQLDCENNRTTLDFYGDKYYVQEISYENRSIRVVHSQIDKDQCSFHGKYFPDVFRPFYRLYNPDDYIYVVSCPSPVNFSNYIDFSSCANSSSTSPYFRTQTNSSSYLVLNVSNSVEIHHSCTVEGWISSPYPSPSIEGIPWNLTISDINQELLQGFQLEFWDSDQLKNKQCFAATSCGDNIVKISYPFYLKGHPRSCGDGLACENNRTTLDL
ncbi:uncharacterized protein LOC132271656 [Cornus florida]|uniref:uncharacterized protein LOC132271656 n=1 Tax=Cornus florida TaxID=4283 RepID=UPI00289A57A7|nr:uncharacterized protein LOC132271656 [Cornus florida]